jgi:hypothetical protein
MCWVGQLNDRRVANEDITAYKILARDIDGKYVAPYLREVYHIGEKNATSLKVRRHFDGGEIQIKEGFHSFKEDCLVHLVSHREVGVLSIPSTRKLPIPIIGVLTDTLVAAKCTIPEGAVYYENKDGEIVSTNLIINEIYDIPRLARFNELKM